MAPKASLKLTYEDYVLIPNDGKRHEIIDGEHYVSPSPKTIHQWTVAALTGILRNFVFEHRLGEVYAAPYDVVLSDANVFQPDLVFVDSANLHLINEANLRGAPNLAVEVLSEGTRRIDENLKFREYERFGVAEYWIVDCEAKTARVYRRQGTALVLAETVSGDGAITSPLFPGLTLGLREIFRP